MSTASGAILLPVRFRLCYYVVVGNVIDCCYADLWLLSTSTIVRSAEFIRYKNTAKRFKPFQQLRIAGNASLHSWYMLVVWNDMSRHAVKEPGCSTIYSYYILLFKDYISHNFSRNLDTCRYLAKKIFQGQKLNIFVWN